MSKKLLKIEDLELSFKMYEGLSYVLKKFISSKIFNMKIKQEKIKVTNANL